MKKIQDLLYRISHHQSIIDKLERDKKLKSQDYDGYIQREKLEIARIEREIQGFKRQL